MTTRREFLNGLAGAALLNVAACSRPSENGGRTMVLSAVIPVMLAGALPAGDEARQELVVRTVAGVDRAIAGLSLATQKEIGELFDLLAFPLACWRPVSGHLGRMQRPRRSATSSKAGATAASISLNPVMRRSMI